jgi:uncharacterized membrane protein (UPF0127 family)
MSEAPQIAVPTASPTLRIRTARTLWERFRGLMGAPPLPPGEALWFPSCNAVHTAFVRAPIDLLFLRGARIVRIHPHVSPWRIVVCRGADSVVELRAGEADRLGLAPDGLLEIERPGRTAERAA